MAKELILAKYGEMALKGLNRGTFEDILMKNLRRRLKKFGVFKLTRAQSTIYMEPMSEDIDLDEVLEHLQCVFGIASLCRACVCEKTMGDISAKAVPYLDEVLSGANTFKVEAKRADKAFPLKSPEICAELGGVLLEAYPHLSVDVHNPDATIMVEIRDTHAFVHGANLKGAGGLPVGSSGKALLLLSGGIDSPVAGYRMARRGVHISAIHYVSPPYTSDRALEKVEQLCQEITPYCGNIAFFCVPFTEIQEAITKLTSTSLCQEGENRLHGLLSDVGRRDGFKWEAHHQKAIVIARVGDACTASSAVGKSRESLGGCRHKFVAVLQQVAFFVEGLANGERKVEATYIVGGIV